MIKTLCPLRKLTNHILNDLCPVVLVPGINSKLEFK